MNDALPTLETFFEFTNKHAASTDNLATFVSDDQMAELKTALQQQAKDHDWRAVSSEVHHHIGDLLDISLQDILVRAWNENKLLDRFLNPQNYGPNEATLLSLKKHTISSQHDPHIDVSLNGKQIGRIDFHIDLKLTLEGVILKIQAGRIREIRSGHLQGSGTLRLGKLTLLKRELCNIDLPGVIRSAEPA